MKTSKRIILAMMCTPLTLLAPLTANAQSWEWSNGLQTYYYRDNAGRVHYADGSVGTATTAWTDSNGKWVYSCNSKGPSDKTGQYAYRANCIDESNIGAAPSSPPANAVATRSGSNGETVVGGTDPNAIVYVAPNSQARNTSKQAFTSTECRDFGYFQCSRALSPSYTVKAGPNGENIYYFQGSNGENVYISP